MKQFNADGIPSELKHCKQWVLWKLIKRGGEWVKMPHTYKWDAEKEEYKVKWASTTDPNDWLTFEDAFETYDTSKYEGTDERVFDGIGFVFTKDDPYVFIDIDDAVNEDGRVNDVADQILALFDTWTEISQSGEGLHIICKADKSTLNKIKRNRKSKDKRGKYEIYTSKRFCAMTGDVVGDIVSVTDCSESVLWFYKNYIDTGAVITISAKKKKVPTTADEVIELLRRERSGKFTELFDDGDVADYGGDESAADMALACKIAFYTQDPDIVEEVFNESALAQRDKWETREDYRERTIEAAIQSVLDSGEWYLSGIKQEEDRISELHEKVGYLYANTKVETGEDILYAIHKPYENGEDGQLISIGYRANITTIVAQSGWGKSSAVVGGIIAAVAKNEKQLEFLPAPDWVERLDGSDEDVMEQKRYADTLGFDVSKSVNRVLVIDTEQDKSDGQRILKQGVCYRTQGAYGSEQHPDWLTWVPALEYKKPNDIYNRLELELESAKEEGNPYDIIILDMVADLVDSINDEHLAIELVGDLRRISMEYNACIVCTAHMNPRSSNIKAAGWLGTILIRRSKTVMTVAKNAAQFEDVSPSYRLTTDDGFVGKNRGGANANLYYKWWHPHGSKYTERGFMATHQPQDGEEYSATGQRSSKIKINN